MKLYQTLKIIRKAQGIKQTQAAKRIGISQSSLANYERGHSTLSKKTLMRLASAININPDFIEGNSRYPFLSRNLIKILLPNGLLTSVDYAFVECLMSFNASLEVLLLKTATEEPVMAILIQDHDGNLFILRHKAKDACLPGDLKLRKILSELADTGKTDLALRIEKIGPKLFRKIADWSVKREDVEEIFQYPQVMRLTSDEKEMILQMRRHARTNLKSVLRLLNT